MKFVEVQPNKDESYEAVYDDKCIVVKQGENKVWISKAMAEWIVDNLSAPSIMPTAIRKTHEDMPTELDE